MRVVSVNLNLDVILIKFIELVLFPINAQECSRSEVRAKGPLLLFRVLEGLLGRPRRVACPLL